MRDLINEYRKLRVKSNAPYIERNGGVIQDEFERFGLDFPANSKLGVSIQTSPDYLLITSTNLAYRIKDNSPEGSTLIGDKLIVARKYDFDIIKSALQVLRALKKGVLRYGRWDHGRFGAVLLDVFDSQQRYPWAIKLYNYAYPLTPEIWEESKRSKFRYDFNKEKWHLSGVTGIGTLIAYDALRSLGFRVPEAPVATSEVLVQQQIDGITIADIYNRYEELKRQGLLGTDDSIIDRISDFAATFPEYAQQMLRRRLKRTSTFWFPYYLRPDINWGNIIIPWGGLDRPEESYYIIDPIS